MYAAIYPDEIRSSLGKTETFTCLVIIENKTSIDNYEPVWYKTDTEHQLPNKGLTLTIKNVRKQDFGVYMCKIQDKLTKVSSNIAQAKLIKLNKSHPDSTNVSIYASIYPKKISSVQGETETFTCLVIRNSTKLTEGLDNYEATWYKTNTENILPNEGLILTLKNIKDTDFGDYFCRVQHKKTNQLSNFAKASLAQIDDPLTFLTTTTTTAIDDRSMHKLSGRSQKTTDNSSDLKFERILQDIFEAFLGNFTQTHKESDESNTVFQKIKQNITLLLTKKLNYEKHVQMLKSKLNYWILPDELGFNYFPEPLVKDDEYYLYGYEKLARTFQADILAFTIEHFENKVRIINERLLNLAREYAGQIENLNEKIATLKRKILHEVSNKVMQHDGEKISDLAASKKNLHHKKKKFTFRIGKY